MAHEHPRRKIRTAINLIPMMSIHLDDFNDNVND